MSEAASNSNFLCQKLREMFTNHTRFSGDLYREDMEDYLDEFVDDRKDSGDSILVAISEDKGLFSIILVDENDHIHINKHAVKALKKYWSWSYMKNIDRIIPVASQVLMGGDIYQISAKISKLRTFV